MTHDQLARRVAARVGISIRDARRVLDAATAEINAALASGEPVTIRGVGALRPPSAAGGRARVRRSARSGRPVAQSGSNAGAETAGPVE